MCSIVLNRQTAQLQSYDVGQKQAYRLPDQRRRSPRLFTCPEDPVTDLAASGLVDPSLPVMIGSIL